jgi:toxin ParE1/3/4
VAYEIRLTEDARTDLEELYVYIGHHDSPKSAEYVLTHIEKALESLGKNPRRGVYPPELSALGIAEYREVFFKPYRIIYRVVVKIVYVYLIVDGRRDMQSLLRRRLLTTK